MKNNSMRAIAIAMVAVLSVGVTPIGPTDASAAMKPALSKANLSLQVGKKQVLTLKNVKKKDVGNVRWTTTNKKVVTVSPASGKVKATVKGISAGKATIKAKLNSKTYSCKVSVKKAGKTVKLEAATLPMYFRSVDKEESIKVYFADKNHEIPYINAGTVSDLLERIYHEINLDKGFDVTYKTDGNKTVFTRENGQTMVLDCEKDVLSFKDYDAFLMPSSSPTVMDVLEHYGLINCLRFADGSSYSRHGAAVNLNLGAYGIDLIEKNGVNYMPLQTFGDICTSLSSYAVFLYNGKGIYVEEFGSSYERDLINKYHADVGTNPTRSKEIIDFTYNELCMTLDHFYGLKEQHGITSFDEYFSETGLKKSLTSTDALESSKALFEMVWLYFDDIHSSYYINSWRIGKDTKVSGRRGMSSDNLYKNGELLKKVREAYFPNGVKGYQEIGDTAYITFDRFETMPAGTDYYKNPPTADTTDSVGICLYAFSQITRPGSPVKNVVLDLTLNGGGDSTTASFVMSMFLGKADVCLEDTLTGAFMNESFCCDANLDGVFDDKDSLTDYRLFCLTSPYSFSCANLVPSILKNSQKVKTIGMATGGGACVVMPVALADGTIIRISGNRRLGYIKNGSVYDIDRGVEPDYPITTFDRLFDRAELTKYIRGLY